MSNLIKKEWHPDTNYEKWLRVNATYRAEPNRLEMKSWFQNQNTLQGTNQSTLLKGKGDPDGL